MWYKFAKQGSLWSRISPTFEQDVDSAIRASIMTKTFSEDDVFPYSGYLRAGDFNVVDLEKFQDYFRDISENTLRDYSFQYLDTRKQKSSGHCDRYNKIIVIGEQIIQNLPEVISTLKHEIIHGIEGLTTNIVDKELYSYPGDHPSLMFKDYEKDQVPLGRKELEEKLFLDHLEKNTGYMKEMLKYSPEVFSEEDLKKARSLAKKDIRELDRRARSLSGNVDLYMANPSELRAFRSEFDNFFSMSNLIRTYKGIYESLENGKDLFLKGFYDLIQNVANVDDVSESYLDNSLYSNLLYISGDRSFDWRFNQQVIKNLDPQYVRQIAKYLTNLYIDVKKYLDSYVPDKSETEVIE
jgi:hypothetical protein